MEAALVVRPSVEAVGHDGAMKVEVVENASTDGDEQISIVVPPLAAAAAADTAATAAVAIVRERFLLLRGVVVLVPQFVV